MPTATGSVRAVTSPLVPPMLTPADIIIGKLVASWAISLVFLVVSLPFLVWAWVEGGISVAAVIASLLVLSLVLAVICAVGLMFSTLTARPVASAVLTYLTMAALVFGTLIVFVLSFFLVQQQVENHLLHIGGMRVAAEDVASRSSTACHTSAVPCGVRRRTVSDPPRDSAR